MTTEHLSLIISVAAVLIAALALGWNIYRDVILKARLEISLHIVNLIIPGDSDVPQPQYIRISATNFGPIRVKIMNIALMKATWAERILHTHKHAIVTPDWENQLSGKIPSWIDVGDKLDVLLRYDKESFLSQGFTNAGLYDYYGRSHWAPKQELIEAQRQWKEDFGKVK